MHPSLSEATVRLDGVVLLSDVCGDLHAEGDDRGHGVFLVARAKTSSSRHLFSLGRIADLDRFTACHRYEPYWMKPAAGSRASEVPAETQVLLVRLGSGRWMLVVPLLGELFRFSLRGKSDDTLELLGETGDAFAPGHGGLAAYVAAGADPFDLVRTGARSVARRLAWGRLRSEKPLPDFVDTFGWCTWDAFYQEVSAAKVREGLERFDAGGVKPQLLILDDGWQSTAPRPTGERRLTGFTANEKFDGGLRATVRMAKDEFGVQTFLVWHSIVGYWGGVDGEHMPGYGVVDQTRQFGEGVLSHAPSFNQIWWGNLVGFVPREFIGRFYDDYHAALAAQGVDGVKVDSQAVLEAVSTRQGGRIPVAKDYRDALERSVVEHFGGRMINCMSNAQETWYGSCASTLLRSSIDFFPTMPETHGAHLYTNAQVGLWFGEFMHPDWDMFQSGHAWGAFHAAGRAISGGPVYVSDKPGEHDFGLLRKLVCSDGSVLRCEDPALPTLDTLCVDPTRDGSLLKIWNRNREAGIVGVFNARLAAKGEPSALSGDVGPADIPGLAAAKYACFAHCGRSLEILEHGRRLPVTLEERGFELFTFVPADEGFAPIGLADKFNSSGAVRAFSWIGDDECELALRDGGEFFAWADAPPLRVEVDGHGTEFAYDATTGGLRVHLRDMRPQTIRIRW